MVVPRTKRIPQIIVSQLVFVLIMVAVACSVLFYAEGYRINWVSLHIIKTGEVYFSSYPKNADIYVDNSLQKKTTPYAKNLTPGNYSAQVSKDNYVPWTTNFTITSGFVSEFKNIALFKKNIQATSLTDQTKIDLLNAPIDFFAVAKSDNLVVQNGYEIWQNGKLVTRFSMPVSQVSWYPDNEHILFQQNSEIRVIELNGQNNTLLVKVSSETATNFTTNNKGDELYFVDGGQYKMAQIQ